MEGSIHYLERKVVHKEIWQYPAFGTNKSKVFKSSWVQSLERAWDAGEEKVFSIIKRKRQLVLSLLSYIDFGMCISLPCISSCIVFSILLFYCARCTGVIGEFVYSVWYNGSRLPFPIIFISLLTHRFRWIDTSSTPFHWTLYFSVFSLVLEWPTLLMVVLV